MYFSFTCLRPMSIHFRHWQPETKWPSFLFFAGNGVHGLVAGLQSEAGWMWGLARGRRGAEAWDRRGGGFGSPAVLLGRVVVQSVVGVGQRGPARLAHVQRAHVLIPQPHRAGRGRERSGRKARGGGGASGTSHLAHAAHATVQTKPQPNQKHRQKQKT